MRSIALHVLIILELTHATAGWQRTSWLCCRREILYDIPIWYPTAFSYQHWMHRYCTGEI